MFFITCIEKIETDEFGWLDCGDKRTFGFYANYVEVEKALHTNRCDMHERLYNFAVVESIPQGIHPNVRGKKWFRWNEEK